MSNLNLHYRSLDFFAEKQVLDFWLDAIAASITHDLNAAILHCGETDLHRVRFDVLGHAGEFVFASEAGSDFHLLEQNERVDRVQVDVLQLVFLDGLVRQLRRFGNR
jgi:hypothetical protein